MSHNILKLAREAIIWIVFTIWLIALAMPASYYKESGTLKVDTEGQEEMIIVYTGEIHREFLGVYSVIIRDAHTDKIVAEDRSNTILYKPNSNRPNPITLDWWAPGIADIELPPGYYVMTTCWTIKRPFGGIVPEKHICVTSNVFEVD